MRIATIIILWLGLAAVAGAQDTFLLGATHPQRDCDVEEGKRLARGLDRCIGFPIERQDFTWTPGDGGIAGGFDSPGTPEQAPIAGRMITFNLGDVHVERLRFRREAEALLFACRWSFGLGQERDGRLLEVRGREVVFIASPRLTDDPAFARRALEVVTATTERGALLSVSFGPHDLAVRTTGQGDLVRAAIERTLATCARSPQYFAGEGPVRARWLSPAQDAVQVSFDGSLGGLVATLDARDGRAILGATAERARALTAYVDALCGSGGLAGAVEQTR